MSREGFYRISERRYLSSQACASGASSWKQKLEQTACFRKTPGYGAGNWPFLVRARAVVPFFLLRVGSKDAVL